MGIIGEDDENAVMTPRELVEELIRNAVLASQNGTPSEAVNHSRAALNAANALAIIQSLMPRAVPPGKTNNPHFKPQRGEG